MRSVIEMLYSRRTTWNTARSEWAQALSEAKAQKRDLLDLTVSNPTVCGFRYDAAAILDPLGDMRALTYAADSMGMRSARDAVARYYSDHGAKVDAAHLLLTTSTSEGYSWLFKLLCDAGDEILVPQPSYPLFDYLAELEAVKVNNYPLFYDFGWWIDIAEMERRIGPRTRAIVVVHPNNPTGHATGPNERRLLEEICQRHGLALIVDEVFLDYPLHGESDLRSFASGQHPVPTFVLSGMSKIMGLPQMKAAWIATFGPEAERDAALERLEVLGDTYLSMNAPVQCALPNWIEGRGALQEQIRERTSANVAALRKQGLDILRTDGGWSAILRVTRTWEGGLLFRRLLELGVVVHPGELYGMPEGNRVVVSLIVPTEVFHEGARRIASL